MKSVLIIEDNTELQNLYREALTKKGVTDITFATTAQQGLISLASKKPDLVTLDIMLPEGANGFDVLEQMKKDPQLANIPVVVITNLDSEEKMAYQIGVKDYILKATTPFDQIIDRVMVYLK